MRRVTEIDELRSLQLGILDCVAKFCDEHKIKYWLDYGTLIGAIRHKGYIPWDDDIDISMMREDYEKFIRIFNELNTNKRYEVHCIENDPEFFYPFAKVYDTKTVMNELATKAPNICVYVDVFVYDNAPDDERALKRMILKHRIYRRLHIASESIIRPKGNVIRRICVHIFRALLGLLPLNYFSKISLKAAQRYNSISTRRAGNFAYGVNNMCSTEGLNSQIEVDFECRKFKAPSAYDELLRNRFGDYMQLPPVEERVGHHDTEVYIVED